MTDTAAPPHITDLLDLTPALDAALVGMAAGELKAEGNADPQTEARAMVDALTPLELRSARALVMATIYPAARAIAEQAYAKAIADTFELGEEHTLSESFNPFAEGRVTV